MYLEFVAATIAPRSYTAVAARFTTLVQRRQSLIFWMNRKSSTDMHRGRLFHASQEALRHASRRVGLTADVLPKHFLTKYDLIMLIEHDMWLSQSPAVAEQQHLCWLLGFICGVRPGTIGVSGKRKNEYLQWKDIKITRWQGSNFRVRIIFRYLKGYREDERKT